VEFLMGSIDMKSFGSVLLAATLFAGSAFAATDATGPLAPGKPAGVKKAQDVDTATLLWVVGGGLVVGGIALAASSGGNDNTPVTPSTSGTSP
jgi:hypothetical protein